MAILTKAQLKALWINGYKPTQTDFANLFDSLSSVLNQGSNITLKQETNGSITISASGGGGGDLSNYYTKAQTDSKISEAANNVEGTLLGQSIPESAADTSISDIITELYADGRNNYHSGYTSDSDPLAQLLGFVQEAAARLMFLEGSSYKAIVGIKEASTDIICAICWGTNEPTNMFTWASSGEDDVKILPSQRTPTIIDSFITSISTDGNTIPLKDPEILKPTERAQVTTTIVSQSYVAPGETINIVNSATGNFDLYLQDGMDKSVYPYFRDTILDVPAGAKPIFSVWDGGVTTQIKKTAEVDSISATSGRKVYAIHWVPTGTSASDRSCVAYINVANYI